MSGQNIDLSAHSTHHRPYTQVLAAPNIRTVDSSGRDHVDIPDSVDAPVQTA